LQLVEGMEGVEKLKNYQFLSSRSMEIDHSVLIQKMRRLDTVCKNAKKKKLLSTTTGVAEEINASNISSLDYDKQYQVFKGTLLKILKKQKEDIGSQLENFFKSEQQQLNNRKIYTFQTKNALNNQERPLPSSGYNLLDGETLGKLLEIRMFLKSVQKLGFNVDSFPSYEDFILAYKAHSPIMKSLTTVLKEKGNANVMNSSLMTASKEFHGFWIKMVVNLTQMLYSEYERTIGLDLIVGQTGELKLSVNELTWKQILKCIFISRLCKDIDIPVQDIIALLKAKGFVTSPETIDKKTLKLIRRRMLYLFSVRSEFQETVTGFQNGITVKIPTPGKSSHIENHLWLEILSFLLFLQHHEDSVPENVWLVYDILELADESLQFESSLEDVTTSQSNSQGLQSLVENIKECLALPHSFENAKVAVKIISEKVSEYLLHLSGPNVDLVKKKELTTIFAQKRQFPSCSNTFIPDYSLKKLLPREKNTFELDTDLSLADSFFGRKDWSTIEQALLGLSLNTQHCFNVLINIVDHPTADQMISPSDLRMLVNESILPLSFAEIQENLLQNKYQDKITPFYCDMNLIFEIVFAKQSETNYKLTAYKLQTVFERLFYEMVICCESPLIYSYNCPVCRASEATTESNLVANCERCEACFHLACLEPPYDLTAPPKGEWYCPSCIEQRGIANAHPYRLVKVIHPLTLTEGEVVGIEQSNNSLIFVVDFKSFREFWKPEEIRKHAIKESQPVENFGITDYEDYDEAAAISHAYQGWGGSALTLPGILAPLISGTEIENQSFLKAFYLLCSENNANNQNNLESFSSNEWIELIQAIIELFFSVFACPQLLPAQEEQEQISSYVNKIVAKATDAEDEIDNVLNEESSSSDEEEDEDDDEANEIATAVATEEQSSQIIENIPLANKEMQLKGREDALLYVFTLRKWLEELLLSGKPIDTIDFQEWQANYIKAVAKQSPEIESNYNDWLQGWETELEPCLSQVTSSSSSTDSISGKACVCCLCGKTDLELCSPLVTFDSLERWVDKFGNKLYHQGKITREIHKAITRNNYVHSNSNSNNNQQIAHTFCADLVNLRRASLVIARKASDTQFLVERISKIGLPIMYPIGMDRNGCLYWIFEHPYDIFVGRPASFEPLAEKGEVTYSWTVYSTVKDVKNLFSWLNEADVNEKILKKIIKILHPKVTQQNGSSLSLSIMDSTNNNESKMDIDEEDEQLEEVVEEDEEEEVDFDHVHPHLKKMDMNPTSPAPEDEPDDLDTLSSKELWKILASHKKKLLQSKSDEEDYQINDNVYVKINDLPWLGVIEEEKSVSESLKYYKVTFDGWENTFSGWYTKDLLYLKQSTVQLNSETEHSMKKMMNSIREKYYQKNVFSHPAPLNTLQAIKFLKAKNLKFPFTFSIVSGNNANNCPLYFIKMAMYIIYNALPTNCIDFSEERWGDGFHDVWLESVNLATDPISLMQCQLMLEYGIQTKWLTPTGLKFFTCLPSRIHALRTASYPAVAERIWTLDMTIKYEKLEAVETTTKAKKR
jgi:hypothetical protein